jgi:O-antigen/teichoic acid export membrane protein
VAEPLVHSLRRSVLRGLGWKFLSVGLLQLSRLTVGLVLARLLGQNAFGVAGMALVLSGLVLVFSDLALGAALVQRRVITEADKATVFWTGMAAGTLMTGIGVAAAGPIASFYHTPQVKPLVEVASLMFVLSSLGTTQATLMTREMNFRALELRTMAGGILGAGMGIGLALAGYGPWAIIGQQLVVTSVSTILIWRFSPWRPSLVFSLASLRSLGGFSFNVFVQRLLYYVHRNIDNVLVGRFIGAAALGAYSLSYNVMLVPFSRLGGPIQQVLFPAFARMQEDSEWILRSWVRMTRAVGAISIPALLGLMVVAPDFVPVILGDKWHAAIRLLQVLAWVGLLQSLGTVNGDILQARDRTRLLLWISILTFAGHIAGFAIGLHWGVVGVASGYAISTTIASAVNQWAVAHVLEVSVRRMLSGLAGVAAAAVVMAVMVLVVRLGLRAVGVGATLRLFTTIAVGLGVYVPLVAVFQPELLRDLRDLRRRPVDRPQEAPAI